MDEQEHSPSTLFNARRLVLEELASRRKVFDIQALCICNRPKSTAQLVLGNNKGDCMRAQYRGCVALLWFASSLVGALS